MQFENRGIQILKDGEFDLCPRRNLVQMGGQFGVDLVVIHPQSRFLRRPGRERDKNSTATAQKIPPGRSARRSWICIKENLPEMGLAVPMMKTLP